MDRRQEDTKEAVLGTHRMVDKAEVGESQLTLVSIPSHLKTRDPLSTLFKLYLHVHACPGKKCYNVEDLEVTCVNDHCRAG